METKDDNNNNINDDLLKPNSTTINGVDLNQFKSTSNNFYSKVLYYIGWGIVILGTIGSLVLASDSYQGGFIIFLIGFLTSLLSGFIILGLSEIINILDDNRKLLTSMSNRAEQPTNEDPQ